ncbi:hypothetical protein CTAYLR_003848 [Chrysophaeum taylorii]|uniref:Nephrocystin 3-like N-terminal domain-containing protein n=1 Tax=Chrysophaeum taylorii TaxID=2483200 RepID=A0AAD7UEG1_9STRA|nr:hypothetical protein CTAYLR_003848 [Chrysophaeum taylorii]
MITGIYGDPLHLIPGSLGGLRVIAMEGSEVVVVVGCDDGELWWTLFGRVTEENKAEIDFAPKAPRVGVLEATATSNGLAFADGNTWSKLDSVQTTKAGGGQLNGLYKEGAQSLRVVSDRLGKTRREEIVVVGVDDDRFWTIKGGSFNGNILKAGDLSGTFADGVITFSNTTWWAERRNWDDFDKGRCPRVVVDNASRRRHNHDLHLLSAAGIFVVHRALRQHIVAGLVWSAARRVPHGLDDAAPRLARFLDQRSPAGAGKVVEKVVAKAATKILEKLETYLNGRPSADKREKRLRERLSTLRDTLIELKSSHAGPKETYVEALERTEEVVEEAIETGLEWNKKSGFKKLLGGPKYDDLFARINSRLTERIGALQFGVVVKMCAAVTGNQRRGGSEQPPISELRKWLRPVDFGADVEAYEARFVEGTRTWFFDSIKTWRRDLDATLCRAADAGFGKTAIMSHLVKMMDDRVLAVFLCRHDDPVKRDPRHVITTLAWQMAQKREPCSTYSRAHARDAEGTPDAVSISTDARVLADRLIFQPLGEVASELRDRASDGQGRFVILIDALDEAEHNSKNKLLELVARDFAKLPSRCVCLVVTARREVDIRNKLAALRPDYLNADKFAAQCADDVDEFLRQALAPFFEGRELATAVSTIAAKAKGSFLYLQYVREGIARRDFDFDGYPDGLPGVYENELRRVLGEDGLGDANSETRRVVEAIVTAQAPLHVADDLPGLSSVGKGEAVEIVRSLSQFFPVTDDDRISFYHKSFVDWLISDGYNRTLDNDKFKVDATIAHRRLAASCATSLVPLLSELANRFGSDMYAIDALRRTFGSVDDGAAARVGSARAGLEDAGLALLCSFGFVFERAAELHALISDAALLPRASLVSDAFMLAQHSVREAGIGVTAFIDADGAPRLATYSYDPTVRVWDPVAGGDALRVFDGHSRWVNGVTAFVGADGAPRLASCFNDRTVCVWDPVAGGEKVVATAATKILEKLETYLNGRPSADERETRLRDRLSDLRASLIKLKDRNARPEETYVEALKRTEKVVEEAIEKGLKWNKKSGFKKWRGGPKYDRLFEGIKLRLDECINDLGFGVVVDTHGLAADTHDLAADTHDLAADTHDLAADTHDLAADTHAAVLNMHHLAADTYAAVTGNQRRGGSEQPPISELRKWLRPVDFGADIEAYETRHVEGTRTWFFDSIKTWRRDLDATLCRAAVADAGFGKTAIMSHLVKMMGDRVLAVFLCRHNDPIKRDPRHMITTLAWQMAQKLEPFRRILERTRETEGTPDAVSISTDARVLADRLIFQPLSEVASELRDRASDGQGRFVILIDALDEAEHNSKNKLLELVARDFAKLPSRCVCLLVTARREVDIRNKLAALRPDYLNADKFAAQCADDVDKFLRQALAPFFEGMELATAVSTIAAKAKGSFLYLQYVREGIARRDFDFDGYPDGLPGVYENELRRVLGEDGLGDANSETRRVVEAIVTAQAPLHVADDLPGLSGVGKGEAVEIVRSLSQFFPVTDDDRISFYHKSFVDWLISDGYNRTFDNDKFKVDTTTAHRRLAAACATSLVPLLSEQANRFESDMHAIYAIRLTGIVDEGQQLASGPRGYALRWIVIHLLKAGLEDAGLALLCSLGFVFERAAELHTLISDAALLPRASLVRDAFVLAQHSVRKAGTSWLAEELWQRLLPCAGVRNDTVRLARDARKMARSALMYSAREPYFTPAGSALRCVLEGHSDGVNGVTAFVNADGAPRLASCSWDRTVRVWDPVAGGDALRVFEGHADCVIGVTAFVNADGAPRLASCSYDRTVRVWDPVAGGDALRVFEGHSDRVKGVTDFVDADGAPRLASCSHDRTVRVWDPVAGGYALRVLEGHSNRVTGVTAFIDADGARRLASCSHDRTVRVWDPVAGGDALRVFEGHSDKVIGVTAFVDADGAPRLASCSYDGTVRVWNPVAGGDALRVFEGHSDKVIGVTDFVDANGARRLASCSWDQTVRVWDPVAGGDALRVLKGHSGYVNGVAAFVNADDAPRLVSYSDDRTVRVWDPVAGGDALRVLEGHSHYVTVVTAFVDANGARRLASCSYDRTVRVWDPVAGGDALRVFEGHSDRVNGVTAFVDADGAPRLASCSEDRTVRVWDPVAGGDALRVLEGHSKWVTGVTAFVDADDAPRLASCSWDRTVRAWDPVAGGDALRVLEGHSDCVIGVTAFVDADDAPRLASCSKDRTVRVWDPVAGGDALRVLEGHSHWVTGVTAFVDANGARRLASCSYDRTVRVWDPVAGGDALRVLEGHSDGVNGVTAFVNADGARRLASCSYDRTVRVWDPVAGCDALRVLEGHSNRVTGVTAFVDADGARRLASCSLDRTVRVWDPVAGGGAVCVILLHKFPTALTFSSLTSPTPGDPHAVHHALVVGHYDGSFSFWERC